MGKHSRVYINSLRTNVIPPHLSSIPRAIPRQAKMAWRTTGVGWNGLAFRLLDLARGFKVPRDTPGLRTCKSSLFLIRSHTEHVI